MIDKSSILQIIGSLMRKPSILAQTDRYHLDITDFSNRLDKFIFAAIENLYRNGANKIAPIDIENYLETNDSAKRIFVNENGIEYLQDAEYLSDELNFDVYYKRLKKFNLLNSLNKSGIDTTEFYNENLTDPHAAEVNDQFEYLTIEDIINRVKGKVLTLERKYSENDATETETAFEGMDDILTDAIEGNDIGLPIQGQFLNEVVSGARTGALYIRSASSGLGKTRQAVGDACYLAYPIRYENGAWVQNGSCQKVLFIATEQDFKEIRKMILAYLTNINESRFRYGDFTKEESKIIKQALEVMELYKDNFYIVRMPNPTIELVQTLVRENCLLHDIKYVFYDYIFIGPSLLNEFKGISLRNDEVLLMFANALKNLAVELNIFVMTSTQLNANGDNNQTIRGESALAGGRATINKADIGVIAARPSQEELDAFREARINLVPNMCTDIFKVRSGQWTQVRIWSLVDLGTLRKRDLFVTDARLQLIADFRVVTTALDWDKGAYKEVLERLNNG